MGRFLNTQHLLWVALVLALASSLGHVAYAFSTVNGGNWVEAYISAVAIDLGLLALAHGIAKRRSDRRGTSSLWGGVVLFSLISTYANWLAGIMHIRPVEVELSRVGQALVSLRPLLLSAVLPVLVIYLSEIVSGNHQVEVKAAEREAQRAERSRVKGGSNGPNDPRPAGDLSQANETRQAQISQRRDQVLSLLGRDLSQTQIADELAVSLATVKRDIKALNGKVKRDVN